MSEQMMLELLGYVASILVAISLTMRSILRLRVINLVGAVTFAIYGWLIGAIPVAAVNLFIVGINIFYLREMLRGREFFRLLEITGPSEYVRLFLDHYGNEIRRFTPDAAGHDGAEVSVMILRDLVPAGLLMGDVDGSTLRVKVDFVIPQFRDFKVGRYLYEERADFFRRRGIREIESPRGSREHEKYLRRMGFEPVGDGSDSDRFRLAIA
jgi:GNAT superfamily N-acetyltransferase